MSDITKSGEDWFEHHGVKGMKWGVRNDRGHEGERAKTKVIAKADKKYEKSFSGFGGFAKVHNEFASQMNSRLGALNDAFADKDVNLYTMDAKDNAAYLKEYEKVVDSAAAAATKSFGTNASGTKQVRVVRHGNGVDATWAMDWEDIKHADENRPRLLLTPTFNAKGIIIGQTIEAIGEEDNVQHFETAADVLEHHGVKGMHWGVRKAVISGRDKAVNKYNSLNDSQKRTVKIAGAVGGAAALVVGPTIPVAIGAAALTALIASHGNTPVSELNASKRK